MRIYDVNGLIANGPNTKASESGPTLRLLALAAIKSACIRSRLFTAGTLHNGNPSL